MGPPSLKRAGGCQVSRASRSPGRAATATGGSGAATYAMEIRWEGGPARPSESTATTT